MLFTKKENTSSLYEHANDCFDNNGFCTNKTEKLYFQTHYCKLKKKKNRFTLSEAK